jgi:hypothetical protein
MVFFFFSILCRAARSSPEFVIAFSVMLTLHVPDAIIYSAKEAVLCFLCGEII